ncbi:hypothetical protein H257_17040 [Aphanomyces astaci]|uniref:Uncharacterized protein n=1 Tax=Aphanomyces astaci TaxID=112090 RepID=W4FIH2_APHAT|nr:hypothetical protein H257_17040 [Aphanomyces astaci]ETV66611.1 hypothetical protein H257_17040 [Aphanomyces astaci]|eukprot:XP_009843982.1 hypothetical protein H257_17040 [Aphanomyces astaci]
MPSMVPRRLPRHHRRSHPPTGVDINFGSYENPPHLFAWSRSPDAALEAEKSNETKRCDQVRPAAVPATVLSPEVVTDRSILVTPPTTTPAKGVEFVTKLSNATINLIYHYSPHPKHKLLTWRVAKIPFQHRIPRIQAATHEYWEWLHWYSSWQLYYQQHHELTHPLKRNPTVDVVAKPIPVTTCTRQKDKALPRRNSMSFWVDAGKPLAVSDGGPSRAKPHVKPRPTQSTPCWQSNANFEATRASSVATEVAVMPMAQMPMAAAAAPSDGKGTVSHQDTDKELTLEELAC